MTLSPLLPAAGIRGKYLYAIVYAASFFVLWRERRAIPKIGAWLAGGVWVGSCFTALYWQVPKIAFLPYFFVGSVLIAGVAREDDVHRFINLCTLFLLVMLALSWAGFLFVAHGGESVASIFNPDGRENLFYLTTFSNWRVNDSIRPSGVFDEPGTLSFLLCALAALRRIYGRNERTSLAMLILGMVTFSLTHIAFLFLFVFSRSDRRFRFNLGVFLAICAGVVLVYFCLLKGPIDDAILWKFKYHPETHTISGDNRSEQVQLARSKLTVRSFFWGLDSLGITSVHAFTEKYSPMTANPMGPLLTSGILVSFPYYFFLGWLGWKGIRRRDRRIYLAVLLLFLPRPYVTSYGYAVWAMLFLYALSRPASCPAGERRLS